MYEKMKDSKNLAAEQRWKSQIRKEVWKKRKKNLAVEERGIVQIITEEWIKKRKKNTCCRDTMNSSNKEGGMKQKRKEKVFCRGPMNSSEK